MRADVAELQSLHERDLIAVHGLVRIEREIDVAAVVGPVGIILGDRPATGTERAAERRDAAPERDPPADDPADRATAEVGLQRRIRGEAWPVHAAAGHDLGGTRG